MRSFHFRLATLLRYRDARRRTAENAVAAAAARLGAIEALRSRIASECAEEEKRLAAGNGSFGDEFVAWSGYSGRARRQITALEKEIVQARGNLTLEQKRLVEADRDVRMVEHIKEDRLASWRRELTREETALADEAFLARRESEIIRERKGA